MLTRTVVGLPLTCMIAGLLAACPLGGCSAPGTPTITPPPPTASVSSVASPAPAPAPAPEPPAEALRFTSVAKLPALPEYGSYGGLFATEGTLWLAIEAPLRHGAALYAYDGASAFVEKPDLFVPHVDATMLAISSIVDAGKGTLMLLDSESGGPIPHVHHRVSQNGKAWKLKETLFGLMPLGIVRRDGAMFTLTTHYMSQASGIGPAWYALSGTAPKLALAPPTGCASGGPARKTLLEHEAVASTPTGTVVSYGLECRKTPAVEIWPAGSTTSKVTELPVPPGKDDLHASAVAIHAASDADVRVVGAAYWRSREGSWVTVALPEGRSRISAAAFAPDGTLYAMFDHAKLYRHDGDTWSAIEAPEETHGITFGSDGKVWALSETELLVLSTKPAP